ncbi:MAG: N-acetylmuramoyl-L-alanine amidase [Caldilinea sp.]|jgi:N-acetyl-anhydromuramyl-L-alanine amidase AmpD|uniref:N-acetylmuramoyl-L-alanine amidase n=1 Tax=Caldilinea sp. TaxID=2293560 RepID=UPI0030A9503E
MPRPLFDSPYIFGIHEPGGEHLMLAARKPGWILFSEVLGHDPNDLSGVDYSTYANQGFGVIVRLNHGHEPEGTIPHSSQYEAFARRVANFVGISRGAHIWVIGNEMNYAVERPGVKIDWSRHNTRREGPPEIADPMRRGLAIRFNTLPDHSNEIRTTRGAMISPGEVITPELYARCYRLCRDAIHRLPGHEDDLVLVGAVAPWNTQTIYPGNPNGDWVQYFQDILTLLGPDGCDGFALHAYTHGASPALISSSAKMAPPFQNRHLQFRAYMDFMNAVPASMRHLAAFLTEVGQVQPWVDQNSGWVQAMYSEIDLWNRQPGAQQIRAAILYRWPALDRWHIEGKKGVIEDFQAALTHDYRWRGVVQDEPLEDEAVEAAAPPQSLERLSGEYAPPVEAPAAAGKDAIRPVAVVSEARSEGRPRKRMELPAYSVEWISDDFPAQLYAGQVVTALVTLRNAGSLTWQWGGGNPFRIGYRYYRNRRPLKLPPAKDLRTDIPDDVEPGQIATVQVRIALPDEPGNYTLELDLVHEGVAWFKEKGSPVLTRWLTVEAPQLSRVEGGEERNILLPVRLFTDVSRRLPRSGAPYARRNLNQIRYIVVNQTGAHPLLSLERVARAHIKAGYPGIAYDFVIDAAGEILKVKDLEDVAQPDKVWSEQGVNICLAGRFDVEPPSLPQLDAAGRLCAWLAQNMGLDADAIVGLGELIPSDSPGATFYTGPRWKEVLARQVRLHLAALSNGAQESAQSADVEQRIQSLQTQNQALAARLAEAESREREAQSEAQRLAAEVKKLRRLLEEQSTVVEGGLRLHKSVERLPRDRHRYVARRADEVQALVIYDTGASADTPLEALADQHRQDWPGILYDFVIMADGSVHQTQPLDQTPETPEPYIRNAVSIAFAGDLHSGGMPTPDQLAAGGALIAWLLKRFPHLTLDAVKGIGEYIATPSPGVEWATWKAHLLAAARRAAGMAEDADDGALRLEIARLENELASLRSAQAALEEERVAHETEIRRLREELATRTATVAGFVVPPPPIRDISDQLPKHARLRYERRPLSQITHIAIHHTAAPPRIGPARIAELHIASDPVRGKEAWPGIGYHYFIHEDGCIEQTNDLETVSYHVTRHSSYSVGVVFAGSFMNGKIPTSAQLRAGAHLVAWLMQELNIPLARVWGHREFPDNMTVCPGSEWTQGNRWRDLLFEQIGQIQRGAGLKTIRHYLLLPDGPGSADLFDDAMVYIARYRPTVGSHVEEARNAEYVTILGSEAGVSAASEQQLVEAGCKVERIVGRTDAELGQMLAELVRVGRRFRSFEVNF